MKRGLLGEVCLVAAGCGRRVVRSLSGAQGSVVRDFFLGGGGWKAVGGLDSLSAVQDSQEF